MARRQPVPSCRLALGFAFGTWETKLSSLWRVWRRARCPAPAMIRAVRAGIGLPTAWTPRSARCRLWDCCEWMVRSESRGCAPTFGLIRHGCSRPWLPAFAQSHQARGSVRTSAAISPSGSPTPAATRLPLPRPPALRQAFLSLRQARRSRSSRRHPHLYGGGQETYSAHSQGLARRCAATRSGRPRVSGRRPRSAGRQRATTGLGQKAKAEAPVKGPTPRRPRKYTAGPLGLGRYSKEPGDGRPQPKIPARALLWGLPIGELLREYTFSCHRSLGWLSRPLVSGTEPLLRRRRPGLLHRTAGSGGYSHRPGGYISQSETQQSFRRQPLQRRQESLRHGAHPPSSSQQYARSLAPHGPWRWPSSGCTGSVTCIAEATREDRDRTGSPPLVQSRPDFPRRYQLSCSRPSDFPPRAVLRFLTRRSPKPPQAPGFPRPENRRVPATRPQCAGRPTCRPLFFSPRSNVPGLLGRGPLALLPRPGCFTMQNQRLNRNIGAGGLVNAYNWFR